MKLLGYEFSSGEFTDPRTKQNIIFDNVILYFEKQGPQCHGVCFQKPKRESNYKIKRLVLENAVKHFGLVFMEDLIDKDLQLYFDEYGKIVDILSIK